MTMNSCETGHDNIYYFKDHCPCCANMNRLAIEREAAEARVKELEEELENNV